MHSPRVLAGLVAISLVACGDAATSSDGSDADASSTTLLVKPTVSIPDTPPTELIVTDLVVGRGPAAQLGDQILVHYVGVLTADGQEFDNNYGGEPFEVLLGAGKVIQGWDQGLVGVQQGTRRQIDIPPDLAYGDFPPNGGTGLIKAGAALSFVVDVVVVFPRSSAADAPQIVLAPAANVTTLQSTDLIVGSGASPQDGQSVAIHIVLYRADTGALLTSDWGGPPLTFAYAANTRVFPGLLAVVKGMKVGGRRQTQLPYTLMFDGQGNADLDLPAGVDVVVVVDLIAVY